MKISRAFLTLLLLFVATTIAWTQEMPVHEWAHHSPFHNNGVVFWPHFKTTTDPDGNVYVAGEMRYTFDADPGPGVTNLVPVNTNYREVYIIKYNAAGTFMWAKKWGQPPYEYLPGSLIVDPDGNVFVNIFIQIGAGTHYTRVIKLDAAGNELWSKQVNTNAWGGRAIALDELGNVIIAGGFSATVDFDPNAGVQSVVGGANDLFILKLDANGNFLWVKTGPGAGSVAPTAMTTDPSGNILIAGHFNDGQTDFDPGAGTALLTSVGNTDIFVLKLEPDGDFMWVKQMAGPDTEYAYDITSSTSGDIYVAGAFFETVDFDPNGGTVSLTSLPSGKTDGYLMRLNSDGSLNWVWQFGSTLDDSARGVSLDAAGNILLAGQFQGTVDFDPGAGVTNLTSGGGFFLKMTNNRELIWARNLGTMSTSLRDDNDGMVTAFGQFSLTIDADLGICEDELTASTGWQGVYAVKMSLGFEAQITIGSISPASASIGATVIINGTNFGTEPDDLQVVFANNRNATVTAVTPTQITTTVPASTVTGRITIKYKCFPTLITATDFFIGTPPTPTITSFNPTSGEVGNTVTITGTNFSNTPANNTVQFNGTTAVVTASTATSITVTIPAGATTGKITVTVNGVTATSANNFTVNVIVDPGDPVISIDDHPTNLTVCQGETATFFADASGANNITYQWEYSSNGVVAYQPVNGADADAIEVGTSNLSAAGFYRCVISGDLATPVTTNAAELVIETDCVPDPDPDNEIEIYNAISPNGDGKNETFIIESIELLPDTRNNKISIFNRWGDEVFSIENYNNTSRVFSGLRSDGTALPSGVYFYKLTLPDQNRKVSGYLHLRR